MRANTQQASAWLALAQRLVHRSGGAGAGGDGAGGGGVGGGSADGDGAEVLGSREVDSESFDSWGAQAGLTPTQFTNALRALQTKGLLSVQRSPTLLLSVPLGADAAPFPPDGDERLLAIAEERERALDRLRAVEGYLTHGVAAGANESDALWRLIMQHFGEVPSAPGLGPAA